MKQGEISAVECNQTRDECVNFVAKAKLGSQFNDPRHVIFVTPAENTVFVPRLGRSFGASIPDHLFVFKGRPQAHPTIISD